MANLARPELTQELTFEQEMRVRARYAEWFSETFQKAFAYFDKTYSQALAREYFWDKSKEKQRQEYQQFPPVDLMGNVSPGAQQPAMEPVIDPATGQPAIDPQTGQPLTQPGLKHVGPWDWPSIAQNAPQEFNKHVGNYAELLLKTIEGAQAGAMGRELSQELSAGMGDQRGY